MAMADPPDYQILTGVEEVIKTISPANPFDYWTTISPTSILRLHPNINFDGPCENPSEYPYVIINTGRIEYSKLIERRKQGVMTFNIATYSYSETNVDRSLSRLNADIERAIEGENFYGCPLINSVLSPSEAAVNTIDVVSIITDEGILAPWATSLIGVRVEFRYYPARIKP